MKMTRGSTGSLNLSPIQVIEAGFDTYVNAEQTDLTGIATVIPGTSIWGTITGSVPGLIYGQVRNISTAGQIIRIGPLPDFAAPAGIPLYPGDGADIIVAMGYSCIASAAGAVLARSVLRTS